MALILAAMVIMMAMAFVIVVNKVNVAPRLLGPYVERRMSGHHPLIEKTGVKVNRFLQWLDRGDVVPRLEYPAWAVPPVFPLLDMVGNGGRLVLISDAAKLKVALADARPGDIITLAPGTYRFDGRAIDIVQAGRTDAPIVLRAERSGTVVLQFSLLEGFHVHAPYWQFENLTIVGACSDHSSCEHAFHVVGRAQGVVIRRNDIRDFNAHIKINGVDGMFPDGGRIEGNRLTNQSPRLTSNPVTPIDLVAANDWKIEGNFIADFVKAGGDSTSYGAFAKGGGSGNQFIRNVVLCEHRLRGASGRRVGLSFGGGGSGRKDCRDKRCVVEHERGLMLDNLIVSCSDDGIYVNRSAQTELRNNTLLDTAGLNVRFAESVAVVDGNLLDSSIAVRDGAEVIEGNNRSVALFKTYFGHRFLSDAFFVSADDLDLRWTEAPPLQKGTKDRDGELDLCGKARAATTAYGAFEDFSFCKSS